MTSPRAAPASASSSGRSQGISPRTLSLRLRALEEEGIVERQTFAEVPPRVEYALTEKGLALLPIIDGMREYGSRWLGRGRLRPAAGAEPRTVAPARGRSAPAQPQPRPPRPGSRRSCRHEIVQALTAGVPVASLDPVRRVGVTRRHALTLGAAAGLGVAPRPGVRRLRRTARCPARAASRRASGWTSPAPSCPAPDGLSAVLRAPRRFDLVGVRDGPARLEVRTRRRGGALEPVGPAARPRRPRARRRARRRARPPVGPGLGRRRRRAAAARRTAGRASRCACTSSPSATPRRPRRPALRWRARPRSAGRGAPAADHPPLGLGRRRASCRARRPATATCRSPSCTTPSRRRATPRRSRPAIVLGIAKYHRDTNGWNDLGYNFLVDQYGQVFEGRAGGVEQPVIGAQAQGYNRLSTGIALLGTFSAAPIPEAAMRSLAQLCAWKLSLHGAPVEGIVGARVRRRLQNRFRHGAQVQLQPDLRPPRRRHDVVPGQRAVRAAARSCAAAPPGWPARRAQRRGDDRRGPPGRALRPGTVRFSGYARRASGVAAAGAAVAVQKRGAVGLGHDRADADGRHRRLGGARRLAAHGRGAGGGRRHPARPVDGRHGDPADQRPRSATAGWAPGRPVLLEGSVRPAGHPIWVLIERQGPGKRWLRYGARRLDIARHGVPLRPGRLPAGPVPDHRRRRQGRRRRRSWCASSAAAETRSHLRYAAARRARRAAAAVLPARPRRGAAAGARRRAARDVDRPARPGLLHARRRDRHVPGPGPGRRPGLRAGPRRARRGGARRRRRWRCWRAGGPTPTRAATALVLCGALALGVDPGQRRLRDAGRRRVAAVRQPADRSGPSTSPWPRRPPRPRRSSRRCVLGPRWLATGFDPSTARAQGVRPQVPDAVLLAVVALSAVGVLAAVGALLATALLVVPAATTRLVTSRLRAWQLWSVAPGRGRGRRPACGCPTSPTRRPGRRSPCSAAPSSRSSPGAAAPGRGRAWRWRVAAVAGAGRRGLRDRAGDERRPRPGRRHHDPARRRRARDRRRRRRRHPAAAARGRPARLRAAAERRARGRRRATSSWPAAADLDDWIDDVAGDAGAGDSVVRVGDAVPDACRTARASTRTGGTTCATSPRPRGPSASASRRRSRRRAAPAVAPAGGGLRAARRAPGRGDRPLHRPGAAARSASS